MILILEEPAISQHPELIAETAFRQAAMQGFEFFRPDTGIHPQTEHHRFKTGFCWTDYILFFQNRISGQDSVNIAVHVPGICAAKIMSMGVIVALGAKVRKAYRNTTFMIHQVSGLSLGTLREMEDTVAEASRINEILFNIIKSKTKVTEDQLNEVIQKKKDWFMTAQDALALGILTDLM